MSIKISLLGILSMTILFASNSNANDAAIRKIKPFDMTHVRLLDGPCKTAQQATLNYLNLLDPDRLLYTMRATAGLPTPGEPLGGWEEPSGPIRGSILGHYLSACALMYASTGDQAIKSKAGNIVSELKICQDAIGTGFLFAAPPEAFSALENDQPREIGVPYYSLHKLMTGLYDMYDLAGNQQALDILKDLTDYFVTRFNGLTAEQKGRMLQAEFGGMTEVMYNLYNTTGNKSYAQFGDFFTQDPKSGIRWTAGYKPDRPKFYESLAAGIDPLEGIHANTYTPEVVGIARRYELTGDRPDRTIIDNFWNLVTKTRAYASGGSSFHEEWYPADKLHTTLGRTNHETCATHNMLKLTRHLFTWTGDPAYSDFYERAFLNGIMGTQNPDTGMTIYYLPMKTGHKKAYGTPYDSFWCCTGSGMENFSKLNDSIYFHDDNAIYVNLFIASTVDWQAKAVKLEQLTNFPQQEGTTLIVHTKKSAKFTINIHIPYWATNGIEVNINGKPQKVKTKPTSYLSLNRKWNDDDKIEIKTPMSLHTHPMPNDPELMAIMYGPLVLAGLTDQHDFFLADSSNLNEWIKPVTGSPLTFQTTGQPKDITLIPINQVIDQPYGIYWVVTTPDSPRHKQLLAEVKERRNLIDDIEISNYDSEVAHNLQSEKSVTGHGGEKSFRHCVSAGWWTWDMKVLPETQMFLACTYWGSDVNRTFDIMIDDKVIATQTLNNNKPDEFFEVEYLIPKQLTKDKEKITLKFQPAGDSNFAGGVFGCVIRKKDAVK